MSRSIHATRAKFREAFRVDYSSEEERKRVLGKIIDQKFVKRSVKENAKRKSQAQKAGLKGVTLVKPAFGVLSRSAPATSVSKEIAQSHERTGYGRIREEKKA